MMTRYFPMSETIKRLAQKLGITEDKAKIAVEGMAQVHSHSTKSGITVITERLTEEEKKARRERNKRRKKMRKARGHKGHGR